MNPGRHLNIHAGEGTLLPDFRPIGAQEAGDGIQNQAEIPGIVDFIRAAEAPAMLIIPEENVIERIVRLAAQYARAFVRFLQPNSLEELAATMGLVTSILWCSFGIYGIALDAALNRDDLDESDRVNFLIPAFLASAIIHQQIVYVAFFMGPQRRRGWFQLFALMLLVLGHIMLIVHSPKYPCIKIRTGQTTETTKYLGNWLTYTKTRNKYFCLLSFGPIRTEPAKCSSIEILDIVIKWGFGDLNC